jgi:hypothetical protein
MLNRVPARDLPRATGVWARRRGISAAVLAAAAGLAIGGAASAALADTTTPSSDAAPSGQLAATSVQAVTSAATPAATDSSPAPAAAPATPAAPSAASPGANADSVAMATVPYTVDAVDKAIGTDPFKRLMHYYEIEMGQAAGPTDPNAPPATKPGWPAPPMSTPPMPFTDWPYGGTTTLGDNHTASVDSPLMVAIQHTELGQAMGSAGIQMYGWVDVGGNISSVAKTNCGSKAGAQGGCNYNVNSPAAYLYNANTVQLDQAVLYVERTPDTVQTDHWDWGFRFSAIYGTDYHYTTSYGLGSYQLLNHNNLYGWDVPMVYLEVYDPHVFQGMMIRIGRYISLPDIEAQLAPNNYMYTHSITYTWDNYTNQGIQSTIAITKKFMLQLGVTIGTEAPVWHWGVTEPNPAAGSPLNLLFPGTTFKKDPGAIPSFTGCLRFDDFYNSDLNLCMDAINSGTWGYNNMQWFGFTFYHKFSSRFHVSAEVYDMYEKNVPNLDNPTVQALNAAFGTDGGTPFGAPYISFNNPNEAYCNNPVPLRCKATAYGFLTYWNYQPTPLDNISLRLEAYDDTAGQRTGVEAMYYDVGLGLQHWLSPQIEFRPEFTQYWASAPAFGNFTKRAASIASGDVIFHF